MVTFVIVYLFIAKYHFFMLFIAAYIKWMKCLDWSIAEMSDGFVFFSLSLLLTK